MKNIDQIKSALYAKPILILIGAVLLETGIYTLFKNVLGVYLAPILSFFISLFIAFWAVRLHISIRDLENKKLEKKAIRLVALWLPFLVGVVLSQVLLSDIFIRYPIDPTTSDIVPALQEIYVDRIQAGEQVYAPFSKYGYTIYPNYLPLSWLPYFFSEWSGIDYRWTAYILFILSLGLWNIRLFSKPFPATELAIKSSLPFVLLFAFIKYRETAFGHAVELTIVAFYFFLALSLFSKNNILKAIGILLPLLSRFSFAFWLLYYGVVLLLQSHKKAFAVIAWSILGVVLIYILPFFIHQPNAFFDGLGYYEKAAFAEWHVKEWQGANETIPFHLKQGASFSVFFHDLLDGSIEERLQIARNMHKILSILAVLGMGFWHYRLRHRVSAMFFALVALKVAIVFFYDFFYVPFFYLYLLPTLLSLPIVFEIPFYKPPYK